MSYSEAAEVGKGGGLGGKANHGHRLCPSIAEGPPERPADALHWLQRRGEKDERERQSSSGLGWAMFQSAGGVRAMTRSSARTKRAQTMEHEGGIL